PCLRRRPFPPATLPGGATVDCRASPRRGDMAVALLTLAVVGTVALLVTTALGYLVPSDAARMRQHFLLALGSTTLLVMAHSFIMFFLIATGVELKDMEKARGWGDSFRRRTVALKSQVFPAMTLALLLVIANFMLGA